MTMKLLLWNMVFALSVTTMSAAPTTPPVDADAHDSDNAKQNRESSVTTQPSKLIPYWDSSDESNKKSIDHTKWQNILDKHLQEHTDGINRFDYKALKEDLDGMESLIEYMLQLQELDPSTYSKSEQLPFWINFYNTSIVYLVTSRFPVDSIRDIKLAKSDQNPLDIKIAIVQDQRLSFNDIRNGILRPLWQDNRVNYALSSASIGCPNLSKQAYTAENMEEQLSDAAKEFVNHVRGVEIQNNQLMISRIYDWYVEDFGGSVKEVISHLLTYAEAKLAEQIKEYIKFETTYDWSVNSP